MSFPEISRHILAVKPEYIDTCFPETVDTSPEYIDTLTEKVVIGTNKTDYRHE